MTEPVPGVHQVLSGYVNAFCIDGNDGLVLIDTGMPGSETKILRAVAELGRQPSDIKHIIVTHAHPDHMGSLAAMVEATGAQVWAHEADADAVESANLPPVYPGPGLLARVLFLATRFMRHNIRPAKVDHRVRDGDELPGGLKAVHAPGHSPGQIALMRPAQKLLFAADAAMNLRGLNLSLMNENQALAAQTAEKLSRLDFDKALFGHGRLIPSDAAKRFRDRFATA